MKIADAVYTSNLESSARDTEHCNMTMQTATVHAQQPDDIGTADQQQCKRGDIHQPEGAVIYVDHGD
jgi:hypothetical protein